MQVKELEELQEFNELDLLNKLIEKAESIKSRTEEVLGNNKAAGKDVRKKMQDIKLIADLIRGTIQNRNVKNKDSSKKTFLEKMIAAEKLNIEKEELKIQKIEKKRSLRK